MSPFGAYLLGIVLVVVGLAVGAFLLNVPPAWIVGGIVVAAALAVVVAARRTTPPRRL